MFLVQRGLNLAPIMAELEEAPEPVNTVEACRMEERPEHGMKILQGLNKLKSNKILCDVTLIAEGKVFTCQIVPLRIIIMIDRLFKLTKSFFNPFNTYSGLVHPLYWVDLSRL